MTYLKNLALAVTLAFVAIGCQTKQEAPTPAEIKAHLDAEVKTMPKVKPPATVTVFKVSKGEPPYRNFHVDITLTNRHDKSMWFVLPFYADAPLSKDEVFRNVSANIMPFESYRCDGTTAGGKGQCTIVNFMGQKKFTAVRLKPKATLRLQDLPVASKRMFKQFEVWEAKKILVNSDTNLEKYLPYATLAEIGADIPAKSSRTRLDLKENGTKIRDDFPKQGVDHIWVQTYDKWKIDVKTKK